MVDDVVATERLEAACVVDLVGAAQVVAHDLDVLVAGRLDDALDGFLVGARHHHHVRRAGPGHHLGFQVAAIHGLEIGYDRRAGEALAKGAHAVEPFGEDQRRAGFQPIDSGAERSLCCDDGFVDVCEVEGDLDDGSHSLNDNARGPQRAKSYTP